MDQHRRNYRCVRHPNCSSKYALESLPNRKTFKGLLPRLLSEQVGFWRVIRNIRAQLIQMMLLLAVATALIFLSATGRFAQMSTVTIAVLIIALARVTKWLLRWMRLNHPALQAVFEHTDRTRRCDRLEQHEDAVP